MLQPGQKVVCIDDKFPLGIENFYVALPHEGTVYTVRSVAPGTDWNMNESEIAVCLAELLNPCSNVPPFRERGFKMERFRPLEELDNNELAEVLEDAPAERELVEK